MTNKTTFLVITYIVDNKGIGVESMDQFKTIEEALNDFKLSSKDKKDYEENDGVWVSVHAFSVPEVTPTEDIEEHFNNNDYESVYIKGIRGNGKVGE